MASKTTQKLQKDNKTPIFTPFSCNHRELGQISEPNKRDLSFSAYDKVRVIQYNLVLISSVPSNLATEELLSQNLYLGRYGTIKKIIINQNEKHKRAGVFQVYVTYQTQLQASIAIIALNEFTINEKPIRASYGTNKYCTYFLKNKECLNPDCIYIHTYEQKNEANLNVDTMILFAQNSERALGVVRDNLNSIIQMIVQNEEDQQEVLEGFPTRMEMINFLIDEGSLNGNQIDQLIQKTKEALKYAQQQNIESKSTSFSTVSSPHKEKDNQDKSCINLDIENPRSFVQSEKIAEKFIINQIMKKRDGNNNRSKLWFATSQEQNRSNEQELLIMKSIIKKHLINSE